MKIAFVGKGGSGKSTLSALYINYLLQDGLKVLALDADINVHLADLLGIADYQTDISNPSITEKIKEYLMGTNKRIASPKHMQNTTPPGDGSRLIKINDKDEFLKQFAYKKNNLYLLQVGDPLKESIGTKCYHNNLKIAEILLQHTVESSDDVVVSDMVAGVDAFSTSMYLHFDILFLVVEPTKQSVNVVKDYLRLAHEAGITEKIKVIGNKIEDPSDIEFIRDSGIECMGYLPYLKELKYITRNNQGIDVSDYQGYKELFDAINNLLKSLPNIQNIKLEKIRELHLQVVAKRPQNIAAFGDLSKQIDYNFSF